MKILDSIIDFPNKTWGEDRLFVSKNQAGVIDGSSPINIIPVQGYQSQAEWLSDNLSRGLSEDSTTKLPIACKTITDNLKAYNSSIIEQFNEYNSPCAVIAGAQTIENDLYGYVLGDCTLSIKLKTGEISLSRSLSILRDWENSVTGAEVKKHDDVSAVLIEL